MPPLPNTNRPNKALANTDILITTQRNGLDDCTHPGTVAWVDSQGALLCHSHAPEKPVFLRSCGKLFQALPLITSEAYRQLTPEELAITCASHTGSAYHQQLTKQLLEKAGVTKKELQCGAHAAVDRNERHRCISQHKAPTVLHHNCSGKHAGMLLACAHRHWPIKNYLEPEHPLQQEIKQHIAHYSGVAHEQLNTAIDGCGVPTFYLPLQSIAHMMAQWVKTPDTEPLQNAIKQHPTAFGGSDRIDSTLVNITLGRVIAKVGADGLLAACHTERQEGVAYKIHSGHEEYRNLAFCHLLYKLGWLTDAEWSSPELKVHHDTSLKNAAGREIGEIRLKFGDNPHVKILH